MLWAYGVLAAVLIAVAVTDLRSGKILNAITYPAVAIGVLGHTVVWWLGYEPSFGPVGSLAGFAAGFLPLLLAWLAGGIGGGDAKLMGAVGALGGVWFAISALFYGLAVAVIMAIFIMLRRRITIATLGRIWRFVCLSFTPAKGADPSTPQSPKIPFGLALCIGGAAAMTEVLIRGGNLWLGGF